ncbi:MAG: ATP-binding cassette domain-containing protein [Bacteroidales bacterium]|nr:ATP-binding cassette domain-containing protein [Bacteroidales bacterium]
MSIKLENISKLYGNQFALKNVSMQINKGEVVGLLGPNGAGKSTLMKIICGYLPPSNGKAFVYGFDVEIDSEKTKSLIGYLPENNPLYLDMYVREYLQFVAKLYKIKNVDDEVNNSIQICGLKLEQNKKIGALSKGYKQRVGLAQALIHQPDVLILDEPTSGLDPNQLIEIRKLIKEVGKEKTVLLSSHIMQEVEAICSRVIILNKGEVVADDLTENLSKFIQRGEKILLELDESINGEEFTQLVGVLSAKLINPNTWEIQSNGEVDARQQLFEFAIKRGLNIRAMQKVENSLEQIFQEFTIQK